MSYFKPLEIEIEAYLDKSLVKQIYQAYLCAEQAHSGQMRVSGEPYIVHPVAVARILASMRMDAESIMASLLHDVLEDTPIDKKTLNEKFGKQVAELVDGVSKLTQISFETRAKAQAENFRKMVLAMAKDIRVIIIKLADRLHNMRTISALEVEQRRRIAIETLEIYSPIANRLGMHKLRTELEELGFSALHPMRYRALRESVRKGHGNRKKMISKIEKALKESLSRTRIEYIKIWGREKNLYSIYKKMRIKGLAFSNIMDIYAFRIIVKDIDTCYRVLGIIHNLYKPVPERFKDYIAIPKVNGYQSLHTILFGPFGMPIEVQIRTEQMNLMAENGIASHWIYKSKSDNSTATAQIRAREWLNNLLELQYNTGDSLEFIEDVKVDLFPDEVYLFTPKGGIMELPRGATPVDFAYAIHSDIGNSCVAAKIDRQLAPLSTQLNNGQTVEIITAPGARPNSAWLSFVVTGKARSNIRHYFKEQKRVESIALGKRLLEAALGKPLKKVGKKNINVILESYQFEDVNDLYESIGLGNQIAMVVAQRLELGYAPEQVGSLSPTPQPLVIKGSEGMVVNFATCCRPIPGDSIVGELDTGAGLIIHNEQCPKVANLRQRSERSIDVCWAEEIDSEFKTDLRVEIANHKGAFALLATAIAEAEANIDTISVKEQDGYYHWVGLTISVKNRVHLAQVMRRVRKIKSVVKIIREKEGL